MMKYKHIFGKIVVLIIGLTFSIHSFAVTISVMTDRDPVQLNESFDMIFEADGSVDDDPDFSPLNRDFQVLSTGVSSNMSIVNGRISSTKQWRLSLMARRTGLLTIPAISFGKDRSKVSSITVTGSGNNQQGNGSNREVFLEVEANPEQPYVQSQVIYKIRLYRAIATTNAVLSDPEVSGAQAVIERLGDDISYETRRLNKRFNVVERTYAVYPQTSGRINIEPVLFQAQAATGVSSFFNSPFGQQLKSVVIQSDPVVLNVKAIPAVFSGSHWLPAKSLELVEEWSQTPPEFRIGEPITRTLTITAKGLMASQLPELPKWTTMDFKKYPDQPVLTDDKTSFGISGMRVEKSALIPGKAGEYIIPGIRIPWWNTDKNIQEYAEIPERRIIVQQSVIDPATGGLNLNPVPLVEPEVTAGKDKEETARTGGVEEQLERDTQAPSDSGIWPWISLGLLVIWLATLYALWISRRRTGIDIPEKNTESLTKIRNNLKAACQANDARLARDQLLQLGRQIWTQHKVLSISDIGRYSGEDLARQIRLLNDALYSRSQREWDGNQLWQAFLEEQNRLKQQPEESSSRLEPLFRI